MSAYIGDANWDFFIESNKGILPVIEKNLVPDKYGLSIFNLCLVNHSFKTVLDFIEQLPNDNSLPFEIRHKISESIGVCIRNDKVARKKLLPALAKTLNGRKYFYETFIDIDYIGDYYKYSIHDNYLKHTSPQKGKKYIADLVFGNAILFIAQLKEHKKKQAIKIGYQLLQKVPIETHWLEFAHPFPFGRLASIYIIYKHLTKSLTQTQIERVVDRIEQTFIHLSPTECTFMLSQMIMALNYVEEYNLVIQLYAKHKNIVSQSYKSNTEYVPLINCVRHSLKKLNQESSPFDDIEPFLFSSFSKSTTIESPLI